MPSSSNPRPPKYCKREGVIVRVTDIFDGGKCTVSTRANRTTLELFLHRNNTVSVAVILCHLLISTWFIYPHHHTVVCPSRAHSFFFMDTKEPYFQDDLTQKSLLVLEPRLLKVPISTNFPLINTDKVQTPSLTGSLRRGSMEPYYRTTSRRNTTPSLSTLSSSALLSDVFDYHYLDQRNTYDNENAIVSDSESDYDDEVPVDVPKGSFYSSDSDADSELEDYNVHFLTFKVNARAQYTRPPRNSMSGVSDYFDQPANVARQFNLLDTYHHPEFAAPAMMSFAAIDYWEDPVEVSLAEYLLDCSTPLTVTAPRSIRAAAASSAPPKTSSLQASDLFASVVPKLTCNDSYDCPRREFLL